MVILHNLFMGLCCVWCFLWGRKCSNTAWLSHSCIRFLRIWRESCKDFCASVNTKMQSTHSKFLNKLGQTRLQDPENRLCSLLTWSCPIKPCESLNGNDVFTSFIDLGRFSLWFCLSNYAGYNLQSSSCLGQLLLKCWKWFKMEAALKIIPKLQQITKHLGQSGTQKLRVRDRGRWRIFYVPILQ